MYVLTHVIDVVILKKIMNEKTYSPIPKFNNHPGCKGHAVEMLDCDYTRQEDRDLMRKIIGNYIQNEENPTHKKNQTAP